MKKIITIKLISYLILIIITLCTSNFLDVQSFGFEATILIAIVGGYYIGEMYITKYLNNKFEKPLDDIIPQNLYITTLCIDRFMNCLCLGIGTAVSQSALSLSISIYFILLILLISDALLYIKYNYVRKNYNYSK